MPFFGVKNEGLKRKQGCPVRSFPCVHFCRVHILKNFRKKLVELSGKRFFWNWQKMQIVWHILWGCFYSLTLSLPLLLNFMISEFCPQFTGQKQNFDKMVKYLNENYFGPSARFQPEFLNSFIDVSDFDNVENTTNGVGSLDRVFKSFFSQRDNFLSENAMK